jgi:predicted deacylase
MRGLPTWLLCLALLGALIGCDEAPTPAPTVGVNNTEVAASPTKSVQVTPTAIPAPSATPLPPPYGQEVLGESWEGRPIVGHRFGTGFRKVVLVGNIHGGTEANTYALALEMIAYFGQHLGEVPPEITLWILPTVNPDGLAHDTRRNAHMVDLNRNADTDRDACAQNDWAEDTHVTGGIIEGGGGPYPFSELETQLLRDFLGDAEAAIFYHSMAGKIFVTSCADHPASAELAVVLSEATGYPFAEEGWVSYPVTGAMVDYLSYKGVAAVELELETKVETEFDRNLAGVEAVLHSLDRIASSQ